MKKSSLFVLFTLLCCQASALDLIETYSEGPSDVEFYHSMSDLVSGQALTFGYGYTEYFNPSLTLNQTKDEGVEGRSYAIGNILHLLDHESIGIHAVVLIERFEDATVYASDLEIKKEFVNLVPYVRAGLEQQQGEDIEKNHAMGLTVPVTDKVELLAELKGDFRRTNEYALGLNYKLKDEVEIITEYSQAIQTNDASATLGLIVTL